MTPPVAPGRRWRSGSGQRAPAAAVRPGARRRRRWPARCRPRRRRPGGRPSGRRGPSSATTRRRGGRRRPATSRARRRRRSCGSGRPDRSSGGRARRRPPAAAGRRSRSSPSRRGGRAPRSGRARRDCWLPCRPNRPPRWYTVMLAMSSRQPGRLSSPGRGEPGHATTQDDDAATGAHPGDATRTPSSSAGSVGAADGSGTERLGRPEILLHAQPTADVARQALVHDARPAERGVLEVDPLHQLGSVAVRRPTLRHVGVALVRAEAAHRARPACTSRGRSRRDLKSMSSTAEKTATVLATTSRSWPDQPVGGSPSAQLGWRSETLAVARRAGCSRTRTGSPRPTARVAQLRQPREARLRSTSTYEVTLVAPPGSMATSVCQSKGEAPPSAGRTCQAQVRARLHAAGICCAAALRQLRRRASLEPLPLPLPASRWSRRVVLGDLLELRPRRRSRSPGSGARRVLVHVASTLRVERLPQRHRRCGGGVSHGERGCSARDEPSSISVVSGSLDVHHARTRRVGGTGGSGRRRTGAATAAPTAPTLLSIAASVVVTSSSSPAGRPALRASRTAACRPCGRPRLRGDRRCLQPEQRQLGGEVEAGLHQLLGGGLP